MDALNFLHGDRESMEIEEVVDAIRAVPFVPFLIRMSNDRIYVVDHPELVAVSRLCEVVHVVNSDGRMVALARSQINSVEPQPALDTQGR
jgi:hypothetical protein